MAAARRSSCRIVVSACILAAVAFGSASCGGSDPAGSTGATTPSVPAPSAGPTPSTPLSAPQESLADDSRYFTDVTEADPALATYEQQQGNVALRALLTDGTAFCALLRRGGGVDGALVAEAVGARSDELQTHLPLSVTTFNTIEAVALLTFCPSEQDLLSASAKSRIHDLGDTLAQRAG
jgi:hypothetical protein